MSDEFEFPVEASHVRMFVRAIGETNPVFTDHNKAVEAGLPGILAPPTFTRAAATFDPSRPWTYTQGAKSKNKSSSSPAGMHAEQHFEYLSNIYVGDVLTVAFTDGETWEKSGRSGTRLVFRERFATFTKQDGTLAVRWRTIGVVPHRS